MTVMPTSCDVADKAVSTEDASSGMEVARFEAVLAALVETKVEAMKHDSSLHTDKSKKRHSSAPTSPGHRSRLTSSSTLSSSHNNAKRHHHHHHHHHHHQIQQNTPDRQQSDQQHNTQQSGDLQTVPKLEPPSTPPTQDMEVVCAGCGLRIADRFYLQAVDRRWHASCLQCSHCRQGLDGEVTCFSRDGNIYCKKDYYRLVDHLYIFEDYMFFFV